MAHATITLDPELVASFAGAIGASWDQREPIPETMAAVYVGPALLETMESPAAGLDMARLIHGGQNFVFHRPLYANEEVSSSVEVRRARDRSGFRLVDLAHRSMVGDELVGEGLWSILSPPASDWPPPLPKKTPRYGGQLLARINPDAQTTERYAEVSGDHNPIHTDPETAREMGFSQPILHGMWTLAQVARIVRMKAGGRPLLGLDARFRQPALPDAELLLFRTGQDIYELRQRDLLVLRVGAETI